jgi:hypothetical protein
MLLRPRTVVKKALLTPRTRVQFQIGAVLRHSNIPSPRVAGFEDKDENEAPHEQLQPATRVQFPEGASNWVDTPFLQATTFEHERRTPNAERRTPNAERRTPNAKRQTPNAKRQTPNAKRVVRGHAPSHQILATFLICSRVHSEVRKPDRSNTERVAGNANERQQNLKARA